MITDQRPLSWLRIVLLLAAAVVATGLAFGALSYVIPLPRWLPGTALAAVVGVLGGLLVARRNAEVQAERR